MCPSALPQTRVRDVRPDDHRGIAELAAQSLDQSLTADEWLREWRWKFSSELFPVPPAVAVAEDASGRIIGHYGSILHRFKVGESRHFVGVPVDNVVAEEYRGGRVQTELFRSQRALAPTIDIDFGLGFPNPTAYRVGKRLLGYRDFTRLNVLRVNLSLPHRMVRAVQAWRNRTDLRVREIEQFDARFGALWQEVSPHLECTEDRSPAFLNWRYRHAPNREYSILALERGDELRGYAICTKRTEEPDAHGGTVLDFITHPDAAEALALARGTCAWGARKERRWLEIAITATWPYCQGLLEAGYQWHGREIPVVYHVFTDRVSQDVLEDRDLWYLTGGTLDAI